jgi:hypothetical protein
MGGGPCIVIIRGREGLAAIDRYVATGAPGKQPDREALTAELRHQIEASCTLSYYLPLYEAVEGHEFEDDDLKAIVEFHSRIAANLMRMSPTEIERAGAELMLLNLALAEKYAD